MRLVFLVWIFLLHTACAPAQVIRPYPNFIQAGISVGDKVTIQTINGDRLDFEVTALDNNSISSKDGTVPYSQIQTISKRAWARPEVPCGGGEPLGCSIPEVLILVDEVAENTEAFEPACVQHDFCYRHGKATYGKDRTACDDEFEANLKNQCNEPKWLAALSLSLNQKRCLFVANQMYQAVRRYGENKFRTNNSSYCEYDGPKGAIKSGTN